MFIANNSKMMLRAWNIVYICSVAWLYVIQRENVRQIFK